MNKKGDKELGLETIQGLLFGIGLIIIFGILIIYIIPSFGGEKEDDTTTFYYKKFVEEIKLIPDNNIQTSKILPFLPKDDAILVGFSKNLNEIKSSDLNQVCGKTDITGVISKPVSCQNNACLCLCEVDTGIAGIPIGLVVNCNSENSICEQFSQNVIGDQTCNYFLYYNNDNKIKEFQVLKDQSNIIIKPK